MGTTNIKKNFVFRGFIIGFTIGVLIGMIFIPFLLIDYTPLAKDSLLAFLVRGIAIILLLICYFPILFYMILNDVYIHADNGFLLIIFLIIFYSFFGLIVGIVYHFTNKRSRILAKTILFIIILLFLLFSLYLYSLGTIG